MQNKTSNCNVFLCESIFYHHKQRHCPLKRRAKVLIFRKYKTSMILFFKKIKALLNFLIDTGKPFFVLAWRFTEKFFELTAEIPGIVKADVERSF